MEVRKRPSWRPLLTAPSLGRRGVVKKKVLLQAHRFAGGLLEILLLHWVINFRVKSKKFKVENIFFGRKHERRRNKEYTA
jgi:hypothetical protein